MKAFAWSFSALTMYEQCPKKYYHIYVAKDAKDEDSQWSADGKIMHDAMKKRIVDNVPFDLPLRHLEPIAAKFAMIPGKKYAEMKLALNRQFEPVDYFANDVWVRVVIDLAITQPAKSGNAGPGTETAIVIDWKTGKKKDVPPIQNALNAAVLARWMPEVGLFKTMFVWLAARDITSQSFTLSKFPAVWNELLPRVTAIEEARKTTSFPAKPSKLCGWCPVTQCPHYEPRSEI